MGRVLPGVPPPAIIQEPCESRVLRRGRAIVVSGWAAVVVDEVAPRNMTAIEDFVPEGKVSEVAVLNSTMGPGREARP